MVTTLHHLVFCSTVQIELTDAQLVALLQQARAYSLRYNITGLLLYHASQFVSVLEGPAPDVRVAYERIRTDARHHNVLLLSDGPAARRTFSDWYMGFVADCPQGLLSPPAGYFDPRCPLFLRRVAPNASPYLLNMLREFVAARPGQPV